jgi:response regulator of citrate/malate metabolism
MNILIVEDDISLSRNLQRTFEKKVICNRIEIAKGYADFKKQYIFFHSYDIILLDIHFK